MKDTDRRLKTNASLVKPTKHDHITCFYKNNKENMKNENVNNNKHNIFTDDAEIDAEQKENVGKMLMNECSDKGKEVNKKRR